MARHVKDLCLSCRSPRSDASCVPNGTRRSKRGDCRSVTAHRVPFGDRKPEANDRTLRVLVVDDDPEAGRVVGDMVSRCGHLAAVSTKGADAVVQAIFQHFDIVILDVHMPEMSAVELIPPLRRCLPGSVFILMSGDIQSQRVSDALSVGADLCLSKPVSLAAVREVPQGICEEGEVVRRGSVS